MGKTILISRTDSIGDVVLTLPMAAILKELFPESSVFFLGKNYTRPVVESCSSIDGFFDWAEVENKGIMVQAEWLKKINAEIILHVYPRKDIAVAAMKSGIPQRIGSTGRLWHYWTCNQLVRLSRKNSDLHEAQLNMKLLKPFGYDRQMDFQEIYQHFMLKNIRPLDPRIQNLISSEKRNVILHPLSKGSAREWGLDNFKKLAKLLDPEKFNVFVTGTKEEGLEIRSSEIFSIPWVYDLTGRLSLYELISFINDADILIAASTGPLHLAAALGKKAIGIYPPIRPMHPGRWAPVGPDVIVMVKEKKCNDCRYGQSCHCMKEISPDDILKYLL